MKAKFFIESNPFDASRDVRARTQWASLLHGMFLMPYKGRGHLAQYLAEHEYGVSIAMLQLNADLVRVIRLLNAWKVPVTAWVVLGDLAGYWTNAANIAETADRTQEVISWARNNRLTIDTFGFDLEMPISFARALSMDGVGGAVRELFRFWRVRASDAQQQFEILVRRVQESYKVECYVAPRPLYPLLTGGLRVPEGVSAVEMLYSSVFRHAVRFRDPNRSPAFGVYSAYGNVNPGRDLGAKRRRFLNVLDFERDLRVAWNRAPFDTAYIFALNGDDVVDQWEKAVALAFPSPV